MSINSSTVAFTFGIFVLVLSLFLACLRLRRLAGNPAMFSFIFARPSTAAAMMPADTTAVELPAAVTRRGLDDSTINNFPKLSFSEMKKSSYYNIEDTSNSSSCSICLADYKDDDIVRLLPDCCHLFHIRCVDSWLKLHNTCPICRTRAFSSSSSVKATDDDDRSNNSVFVINRS